MGDLIYPTEFRETRFPVVNPEFNIESEINIIVAPVDWCSDLVDCDENTDVCYTKNHKDCGFYILRRR